MWPRDALYISYKEENFEYITELEAAEEAAYYCDCCDPSRNRKRRHSSSDSSQSDDEDEDVDDEDEDVDVDDEDDKVSTTSSSLDSKVSNDLKTDSLRPENEDDSPSASRSAAPPGWFGKGRRKKIR